MDAHTHVDGFKNSINIYLSKINIYIIIITVNITNTVRMTVDNTKASIIPPLAWWSHVHEGRV